jgi:hypothetical protein
VHFEKYTLTSVALGIERHSTKRVYTESQTLGIKNDLVKDFFAKSQVLGKKGLSAKRHHLPVHGRQMRRGLRDLPGLMNKHKNTSF